MLRYTHIFIAMFLVLGIATLQAFGYLQKLDHQILDSTHRFFDDTPPEDIIVVEIDEQSLSVLGAWPWPRSYHAALTEVLVSAGARTIVFDILFSETNARLYEGDKLFAAQIMHSDKVFLPVAIQAIRTDGPLIEITPTPHLYQASDNLGHAHIHCNEDGICRSVYLSEGLGNKQWPHITWAVYQHQNGRSNPPGVEDNSQAPIENYEISKNFHAYVPFQFRPGHFKRISYNDALEGIFSKNAFKDKTVFIGVTAAGLGDQITTPAGLIPGVFFHAITFHALQKQSLIDYFHTNINLLIFGLFSFASIAFLVRLSPLNFLLASIGFIFIAYTSMLIFLKVSKTWVPIGAYMLVIASFYPIWSWFKLQIALQFLKKRLNTLSQRKTNLFSLEKLASEKPNSTERDFYDVDIVTKTLNRLEQASTVLDHQQNFIQHTLAQLSEAVVLTEASGAIILFNPTADRLLNIQKISQIQELNKILHPKNEILPDWQSAVEELHKADNFITLELSKSDPNGTSDLELYCLAHKTQLGANKPKTLLFTFTDITPLKQAEQARLDTLNFLSHDLRSPMVSILALIENVSSGKNTDELTDILTQIKLYTERNLSYSENMLLLSKADSIDSDHFSPVDIHSVVDSAYYHVSEVAFAKDISISIQRSDEDCTVHGDANLLERVLINLLSNAIKYCPELAKIDLKTSIISENQVKIDISDNGPGIDQDLLPNLFDRFRSGTNQKRVFGSGLGLFFVKKVIEKHGGQVSAESQAGKGTKFSILLKQFHN